MNHRFRCSCIILFIFYSCISHLYGQVQAVSTVDTGYELWLNYKSGSNSLNFMWSRLSAGQYR